MKLKELLEGVVEEKEVEENQQGYEHIQYYNQAIKEIGELEVEIDEEKAKEKAIDLVEEFFPKGTEDRGKATVVVAQFLIWLSQSNIIKVKEKE